MKQFWELLYYGENHSAKFTSQLYPNIIWVSYYFDNKLISNYLSNILRLIPESRDYRKFVLQHFESHGDEKIFELIALGIDEYKFGIFGKPLCMKEERKIQTLGRFFFKRKMDWVRINITGYNGRKILCLKKEGTSSYSFSKFPDLCGLEKKTACREVVKFFI